MLKKKGFLKTDLVIFYVCQTWIYKQHEHNNTTDIAGNNEKNIFGINYLVLSTH